MRQFSLTHRTSFFARIGLLVLLMIGQTAGLPQYAAAQGEPVSLMNIGSGSVISGSGLSFVPMRLVAPDCTYGGLIKSITATGQYSVTFELCRPDPAFLVRLAMPPFAIYPQEWIEATSDDTNRTVDGLEYPIGTGPYEVSSWDHGNSIIFVKNPDYWGASPQTDILVFRWSDQSAQRLLELQAGTIDGFDGPAVEDYATINADPELQLVYRPDQNIFYVGMTNTFLPFDDIRVRQAVAKAIDRQHIVDAFYPAGSEVATHFTPCLIPNGCSGDDWYAYDPTGAKALLTAAGYPSGFPTHLYYRNVLRLYLPRVADIAQEIHDQLLTNLGIDATVVEMDSSTFIQEVGAGHLNGFHLLGWGVDYPHITNFLDTHFGESNAQFGNPFPAIFNRLAEGAQYADPILAGPSYTAANNAIRDNVPMVPVAHSSSSVAYLADVTSPQASPQWTDYFASSDPGGRNIFRWMQAYEPYSLFCADEADNNTFRACTQVTETLYRFINNGASTEPALAQSCTPTTDLTSYTCTLRQGVKFHDGTGFDANDVVETFAMGLDVSSPYHKGNSNGWVYYNSIFGLMDTAVYTISGNAGIGYAVLKYLDAGNRTVTADDIGNYSFMVSHNWSGTVTPHKTGYAFSPANLTYTNVLSDQTYQDYEATVDITSPSVTSVVRASPNPTSAPTVNFTVTFSEPVVGINTLAPFSDFSLITTGVTGASITDVNGSNSTYTVTVNTGSGNGTIRLDMVDNNTILDWADNPLGGVEIGDGNFTGSEEYTVAKITTKPAIPVLLSPTNGKLLDTLQPILDWKDSTPNLDHYQLQISTNNTFTALVLDETNLPNSEFTFTTDLIPGQRYFWRVRAFNILGATKGWSTVWNFKTPLDKPILELPVCGTSLLTDRPDFDWSDVDGAGKYTIQFSRHPTNFGTTYLLFSKTITVSEFSMPKDLPQNKTLYWRVQAKTSTVKSPWSDICSLTTGNPPSVPVLRSPANGVLVKTYLPTLKWYPSKLPPGTTFKRYELQVDDDSDFSSPVIDVITTDGVITEVSYTPLTELTPNVKYYWRVRAVNLVGTDEHVSGWSKVWYFRTVMLPPVLLLPTDGSTEVTLKPFFDWEDVDGATSYTIQISTSANFSTFLVNTKRTVSEFTHSTNLPKNKVVYWRVRANGPNGPSGWSKFQFTTP